MKNRLFDRQPPLSDPQPTPPPGCSRGADHHVGANPSGTAGSRRGKTRLHRSFFIVSVMLSTALSGWNSPVDANPLEWDFEAGGSAEIGKRAPGLSCSGNCPVLSTEVARAGRSSLKTVVDRINSPTMYRTEVQQSINMDANRGAATTDYWFGFSLYVPSPYPVLNEPTYEIFFQVHSSPPDGVPWEGYGGLSPPLEMNVKPESSERGTILVKLRAQEVPYPEMVSHAERIVFNGDIAAYKTNRWIDFVVHARYDYGSAGFTQIWVDGVLALDYKGKTYYNGHGAPYPKFGHYNGWRTRNIPGEPVTTRTYFHDEYRMAWGNAGSFSAVSPGAKEPPKPIPAPVIRKVN